MNIVADENLAFTQYFFSEFGSIQTKAGRTLTSTDVQQCDALLVRSVTKVNHSLLAQTPVSFIGSATIGTDHLDISFLEQQNITWANAAGCNAQAVAEYVITGLLTLQPKLIHAKHEFCLGIIGLGNVGKRLAALAKLFEWRIIGTDPFITTQDITQVNLETVLTQADAVSIHVPLTESGTHPTHHLLNKNNLAKLKTKAILINSARGSVIEEQALIADIQQHHRQVILDVFEHEPVISETLINLLALATPHIAGYSLEGKARGTQMIYQAFCKKFNFDADKTFNSQLEVCSQLLKPATLKQDLLQYLTTIYDIRRDDQNLRSCLKHGFIEQQAFDKLRKEYPLRREWSAYGA